MYLHPTSQKSSKNGLERPCEYLGLKPTPHRVKAPFHDNIVSWLLSRRQIQGYRNERLNSYWTCAWIIWYMFPIQCEESTINHLVVITPYACWFLWRTYYIEDFKWRPHFQFGVAFWRVVLGEVYFEGPNCVWRALKDFNLEHCRYPTWCKYGIMFFGLTSHGTGLVLSRDPTPRVVMTWVLVFYLIRINIGQNLTSL